MTRTETPTTDCKVFRGVYIVAVTTREGMQFLDVSMQLQDRAVDAYRHDWQVAAIADAVWAAAFYRTDRVDVMVDFGLDSEKCVWAADDRPQQHLQEKVARDPKAIPPRPGGGSASGAERSSSSTDDRSGLSRLEWPDVSAAPEVQRLPEEPQEPTPLTRAG